MARTLQLALLLVAAAGTAGAERPRCRVLLNGEYRQLDGVATLGECQARAEQAVAPLSCARGLREFDFRFTFDGRSWAGLGRCIHVRREPR